MASASNPTPAVTLTSNKPIASPDLSLISELLETIERFPPGIEAQMLLVEHYMSCGWVDAARDSVSELLSIDPKDSDAQRLRKMLHENEKALPAPASSGTSSVRTPCAALGNRARLASAQLPEQ